ncbi:thiamine-phosphate kinase [Natronoglycomyces albus]|uniref:Thiamine-monophosphate kinase n=1 Tax=Natronoglycomyces albus TaxID=2811108 RepID=A0A895XKA5_9ACTN|nr:thiamine-phosphate kinase [Natronoglycomyces albus]QSB06181.1 thiamine-phosphate kinase [Natronoglycomyces albus]
MTETVGDVGEFGMIDHVTAYFPATPEVELGPGDDAAVLNTASGNVVACTDMLVVGRHFRTDWCTGEDVGHRAAAANFADIAAMGARPTALLVAVSVPADLPLDWVKGLAAGLAAEASQLGAAVIGGDTTSGEQLTISVTALGDLQGRKPVKRSGAKPGDIVALAGRQGWAAAGYTVLSRGFRSPGALVGAYRRPEVPYEAGPSAAVMGATAMIDLSDGLLADLGHIAKASQVWMDLDSTAFVVPDHMRNAGEALGVNPYEWIFAGGDDHALLATFPPDVLLPDQWQRIGVVSAGQAGWVTVNGEPWQGNKGWEHFSKPDPTLS